MNLQKINEIFRVEMVNFAFWLIEYLNPEKNNKLSFRLHSLADFYAQKPTGLWKKSTDPCLYMFTSKEKKEK